ncbi:MAG: 3-deoxy-D-manno-octulosonic acid transferase [Bdellovibrionales bacterium]|nr:3-deoxy-D-manno-octulosonic acid transferase [Bdellovibrionales bacterium]
MSWFPFYQGISCAAFAGAKAAARVSPGWAAGFDERSGQGSYLTAKPVDLWLHGASVGEVGGLVSVVKRLRHELPEARFHVSTTSLTGRAEAKKLEPNNSPTLLPFDALGAVSPVLKRLRPKLLAIAETEIWPALYKSCARQGVKVLIFNGRISDLSYPRYRLLTPFLKEVFADVDSILVQSKLDRDRYAVLGADLSRIHVAGSTKYDKTDIPAKDKTCAFAAEIGIDLDAPCLVAGSVRPGEDAQLLEAYLRLRLDYPALQLVMAPRHPEKFEAAAQLLSEYNLEFNRRSAGTVRHRTPIVLLDSMGELTIAYSLATIAYVGGTLVPIGGHNPLEPAAYGIPVIVGPHTENVRDAVSQLAAASAHLEVSDAESLYAEVKKLLENPQLVAEIGSASRQVWEENVGATDAVVAEIARVIGASESCDAPELKRGIR